jgi:hypothetical protein
LTQGQGLVGLQGLELKGLSRAAALLHRAEASLNAFGEMCTGRTLHTFHLFLNAAIGPDSEADGALGHPGPENNIWIVAGFAGEWACCRGRAPGALS